MKFISTTEAGKKWGLSSRRVGILCSEGRIPGTQKTGNTWLIPEDAQKPADGLKAVNI
ncbi:DNA-binding protein [Blautia pseudococcoides]|nr:DNA-binding protein [Blautia pseudococcoides]